MRLYDPPVALLPHGNRYEVELGGAKILLAFDENKDIININRVFDELSLGEYWKDNPAIADQIEKINVKYEDSAALYDLEILTDRIVTTLENIISKGLVFLGVASFEGNAFETSIFDEMAFSWEDQETLKKLYKATRLGNAFPNVKKGVGESNQYVEVNFFGEASKYFTLPNKKTLREIAAIIYPYAGTVSGIVTVAQGAANFIILTESIFHSDVTAEIRIDTRTLNQMFSLIKKGVLAAPISWFRVDLGIDGLKILEGWNEIKDRLEIKEIINRYKQYLRDIITKYNQKTIESILDDDLGLPIDISKLTPEQTEVDLENILTSLNVLNEMQIISVEESLLYDPPKILFAYRDTHQAPIGSSIVMLSVDVGHNISCVAKLRDNLAWGKFIEDSEKKDHFDETSFLDLEEDNEFVEIQDAMQLRDTYIKALNKIMRGSELYLGVMELEANSFEFSVFSELNLPDRDMKQIQHYYKEKSLHGKFPILQDRHITIHWYGAGKEYFTFPEVFPSILDIAETITTNQIYEGSRALGIVCVDAISTYFFILATNFTDPSFKIDDTTLQDLFVFLNTSVAAPLCWFKIRLDNHGNLKDYPYWSEATYYDATYIVKERYRKYVADLIRIKSKEEQYRIYK